MAAIIETVKNSGLGLRIVNGSNPMESEFVSDAPVHINSCGYNLFNPNINRVQISRPRGRLDYQMIYIQEGSGEFLLNNRNQILSKGTLVLFRPHTPQVYSFFNDETTLAYFVHFTGTEIPSLLETLGPPEQSTYTVENAMFFSEAILKISRELQVHDQNYELMCASILVELFVRLSRSIHMNSDAESNENTNAFAPALNIMNNQYQKDLSIDDYAELCGMSSYYFVRKFKEHTGFSPHNYLIQVRMERAKEYLVSTTMNISEISYSVGYDNPLYFSRMFRKYTGFSPTTYRKQTSTPIAALEEQKLPRTED